ncbi:helix-turn-helix domain-containing protein [Anaeromassilibacillus senegalensis]|uniref:helix-turn-helix domain-containing protein n=1 Tax=Anaeromassilibacillus senegalensis TaxID=1673717 RepID=UPI000680BD27|nr:helix-turn-helix transcriptional regulator [Anaeromassilibacillus senegalensis]
MFDVRDGINLAINESGLRRNVVAQRANLTPQQLCDIANKRRRLDANEMFKICEALGITPNDLLAWAVVQPSKPA